VVGVSSNTQPLGPTVEATRAHGGAARGHLWAMDQSIASCTTAQLQVKQNDTVRDNILIHSHWSSTWSMPSKEVDASSSNHTGII